MGSFVFLMTTQNGDASRSGAESMDAHDWVACGPCRARILNDGRGPRASLVHAPAGLAAGLVRLDNRHEISRLAGCEKNASDLAIIVAAIAQHGPNCIQRLVGDFSFVFWDANRRALVAVRDALGARTLYRSVDPPRRSFASHAQLIGAGRPWSLGYVADCFVHGVSRTYTPYEGIGRLPAGMYEVVKDGRSTEHLYWSPYQFETTWSVDGPAVIDEFATLFKDAMRSHLRDDAGCWSHLSGGLDSSSVVSMAGWLAKVEGSVPELRGTITFVDTVGIGDERPYSDAVVRDWPVRNEQLIDYGLWRDDGEAPPDTDEPDGYPHFASDRLVSRLVRSTGSNVLLTGVGPDHYLHGNYSYFADWIARGRIRDSVREMYREALRNKASFWRIAYEHGVKSFLQRETRDSVQWPDWVHPSFARRFPIEETRGWFRNRLGPMGRRFVTQAANIVDGAELAIARGILGDSLDVRYPFFHRPLIELCLRLPPEMKVTDGKHKWILREAMRGILPEKVRRRTSKAFVNVGIDRTLTAQQMHLDSLLEHSVLGEMGCIDVPLARKALAQRTQRSNSANNQLEVLITLETWFTVKSGRWTASENSAIHKAVAQV
jgi:asparagine synthase (glutamine-hydrolysing)